MLCTDAASFKVATLTGHHVTSIATPAPAEPSASMAASRESSKRCADVAADIEKTRESLRSTIDRLQATSAKSQDVMSATADFESRWAAFKAKFDEGINALVDKIGKQLEHESAVKQVERWDKPADLERKARALARAIRDAKGSVIVFTGAGISTAAGIPDYRSPMNTKVATGPGVWTLKDQAENAATVGKPLAPVCESDEEEDEDDGARRKPETKARRGRAVRGCTMPLRPRRTAR